VAEQKQFVATELFQGHGPARLVQELNLEYVGREYFHDGANVTGQQVEIRSVAKKGHDIERLDGRATHGDLITRSRSSGRGKSSPERTIQLLLTSAVRPA
jgi:hypothetical protein